MSRYQAVAFDDVVLSDTISFVRVMRGFVGGGEISFPTAKVMKITAQTIELQNGHDRYRLTRKSWHDAEPRKMI